MGRIIVPGDPTDGMFNDEESKKKREMLAGVLPRNDEGLSAVDVIGRCGVCGLTGTPEWPNHMIPPGVIDKILAYKPFPCFCPKCKKNTEFVPINVKKYPDVPALGKIQRGLKDGKIE